MIADENKRKTHRFDCLVPVDGKDGSLFSHSRTVDISREGIGFLSDHAIPLKEKIAIELSVSPESEPVLGVGEVQWVRKISDSDKYRIGLRFADIIDGSPEQLERSLNHRLPSRDEVQDSL